MGRPRQNTVCLRNKQKQIFAFGDCVSDTLRVRNVHGDSNLKYISAKSINF